MLADIAVITLTVLIVGPVYVGCLSYTGYREGHGDGYLRGRNIAKALKEVTK
jgi:hypothetical protein